MAGVFKYKKVGQSVLVLLLSGCASDKAPLYGQEQALQGEVRNQVPSVRYPNDFLSQQNVKPSQRVPYANQYEALVLTGTYAKSAAVRQFIQSMVQKYGFSETYLNGLFSNAHRLESVINLERPEPSLGPSKPSVGSWTRYRNKFLTDAHINNGVEFWKNNKISIQQASTLYGVDPEYIVGIIGVETYFGKNFGKTCIFDALTTLSFDTQRRSKYFMTELENFLLMTRDEAFDPLQPQGSWAGAMGYGQFMPSSFRSLAVDFNKDGRRDLWHPVDAVGSVAHYFSKSGWQFNKPVTKRANAMNEPDVIELSTYEGTELWQTYPNFKVIKKYNNSSKYAMAVHQLAQAIKARYQASN